MVAAALGAAMPPRAASNRMFGIAVLISIVAHALLLVVFPGLKEAKRSAAFPGPITARLVEPRAAPAPAPAPTPPAPEPGAAPRPRVESAPPPQPVAKAAPAPAAKRAPEAKAAPAAPAAPAPAASAAAPKPAVEAAPATPAVPAAAAAPGPVARVEPLPAAPAPGAEDADTIAKYRIDLISAARRYKTNPRVEGMRDIQKATARVVMVIGANGMIASIAIKQSAGNEILDRNALETLRKAKPLVQIPAALRGREFAVEVPFIYELKDEGA